MPYQPARTIVQSGFRGVRQEGPNIDWSTIADGFLQAQERKYKETNDYYDIQREEMNSLASVLNGTFGADNSYLNRMVIDARNEYKELLKGTKPRDYRSPEIQDKIFEIKNKLARAKNLSATSLEQIKSAYTKAKGTPSIKEGEVTKYLESQLMLPPDQRDPDIANKISTDSLFFNLYDHETRVLDARKTATKPIQRKDDNFFYSYEATYRPDLGYFDKDDKWVFDPREEVIDQMLSNPQAYNAVLGLLPPDQVKKLKDTGNTNMLEKAVRDMAKQHLREVFVREEGGGAYDPMLEQKGRTLNPAKYQRQTVAEKNEAKFDQEVAAIQQRLKDNNPLAFGEYISPDGWRGFDFEYDADGNITGIVGTMVNKNDIMYGKTMGEPPTTTQFIPVDVDDIASVKQALSRIKFVFSKDKAKVTADPLQKPDNTKKPKIEGF